MDILITPDVIYVLMIFGLSLALMALLTPGTGLLEVGALFTLILAGWGISSQEINVWALIVLLLGVFPIVMVLRKYRQKTFLAISIACLIIGSAFLIRGDSWLPVVNPILLVVVSLVVGGFLWIIALKIIEAESAPPSHDLNRLFGRIGETKTIVHSEGSVQIGSERWTARSEVEISEGKRVKVVGIRGLSLIVEEIDETT